MSFLHLKNKKEPKYDEPHTATIRKDIIDAKLNHEKKIAENSNSSLMIGEGVTITGTIKANNEVSIDGAVDGDIECNNVTINKSGIFKGKIKTETMTVIGKAEGEMNVNAVLNIKSEGHVSGKVFYGEIEILEGGKLSGDIHHRNKNIKQEEFKELKSL